MEWIVFNLSPKVRRETWEGRQYLVAPLTLIVPGVLNGSRGPLYYPLEEVAKDPGIWNGVPLTVGHPRDTLTNEHVSGRSPPVIERLGIGYVFNDRLDEKGHRVAEGWFDIAKTRTVDKRILNALEAGKPIELSTGLYTDNEPAPAGATANGRPYAFTARNYRSDHVAILPDESGACSVNDGCGVLVNGSVDNANPEGCNQYKACGEGTSVRVKPDATLKRGGEEVPHPRAGHEGVVVSHDKPSGTSVVRLTKGEDSGKQIKVKTSHIEPHAGESPEGYKREVSQKDSELQVAKKFRDLKESGDRASAEKFLTDVEEVKGTSYLHGIASDHGISLAKNPGGKGLDTATPTEIRKRILDKVFTSNNDVSLAPENMGVTVANLSFLQRFLGWFTGNTEEVAVVNSNPEGINQYTSGHGLSASKDALKRTSKAAPSLEKRANDVVATAGAAHDAGEEGNHELAAQLHQQASDEHDKLADSHERSGQRFKPALHDAASESHVRAALIHSALAQKHKNLIGNAVPNQPRSKVTGRLKKLNAGTGIGDAHESAQRGALQLTDRDRELGKAAAAEKAATGNNPASWVADEDIWEKAKAAADKGDYEKDSDTYWAVVTHIYQQMGGTSKSENTENSNPEGCNQYKECGEGGKGEHHPAAIEAVKKITSQPHSANLTPDQIEQRGKDQYFNQPSLAKAFKNHKEAGKAVRKAYEAKAHVTNTSEGGTSPTTTEGDTMPMTKEERQKAVANLTANCSCKESKAKEEVALNQLSDEFLKSLLGNVQAGTAAAKGFQHGGKVFVFNGERGKFVVNAKGGMDAEDEAECNPDSPDYDEDECKAMNKKTKNATKAKNRGDMGDPSTRRAAFARMVEDGDCDTCDDDESDNASRSGKSNVGNSKSLSDWLDGAPPEIRSVVTNAMAVEKQARVQLVRRIVANLEGAQRKRMIERLADKPLDELRDLALLARPTDNEAVPSLSMADYSGAAGAPVENQADFDESDVGWAAPTMNWEQMAEENRKSEGRRRA